MNKYQEKHTVRLSKSDLNKINCITKAGTEKVRVIKKAYILKYANNNDHTDAWVMDKLGVSRNTLWQTRKRFCKDGLRTALYDEPRPGRPKKLNKKQSAYLTALACTDSPDGTPHWTTRLLAEQMMVDDIVQTISHVCIAHELKDSDIKPWREKNVVRTKTHR